MGAAGGWACRARRGLEVPLPSSAPACRILPIMERSTRASTAQQRPGATDSPIRGAFDPTPSRRGALLALAGVIAAVFPTGCASQASPASRVEVDNTAGPVVRR